MLSVMRRAGRSYIAGPELKDAIAVAHRLAGRGFASTICFWDAEGTPTGQVAEGYLTAIRALQDERLDCYISVKAPPLEYSLSHFLKLVDALSGTRGRLHFDSLGPESADPTFALVADLLPRCPNVTCTLPGRWSRSLDDADWLVQRGVGVRVVKGQWEDPVNPQLDLREGYLNVIKRLAGRARCVAVATHDPRLAGAALQRLREAGTPCELELLFGLPVEPVLRVARSLGVSVRLYIPYGYGWLPYSLAQTRKNPQILWWMLKDMMFRRSESGIYSG